MRRALQVAVATSAVLPLAILAADCSESRLVDDAEIESGTTDPAGPDSSDTGLFFFDQPILDGSDVKSEIIDAAVDRVRSPDGALHPSEGGNAAPSDEELMSAAEADTEPCAGKTEGDPCISTIATQRFCTSTGSVVNPHSYCDEGGSYGLHCLPEVVQCSRDSYLWCETGPSGEHVVAITESVCDDSQPGTAVCKFSHSEVYFRCEDRIGDRFCDQDEHAERVLVIDDVICESTYSGAQCAVSDFHPADDCGASDKICSEATTERSLADRIPNQRPFIISSRATCEEKPVCYQKEAGAPCSTGLPKRCIGGRVASSEGTCGPAAFHSELVCTPEMTECEPPLLCVDDEGDVRCE